MRLVDYKCSKCGKVKEDVVYKDVSKIKKTIACDCGKQMSKLFGAQIAIDDWSPMTNDGKRDVDHFAKKKIINGKYCDVRGIYREDRMKQEIPMNLPEV